MFSAAYDLVGYPVPIRRTLHNQFMIYALGQR
jgi:hypothetical protein